MHRNSTAVSSRLAVAAACCVSLSTGNLLAVTFDWATVGNPGNAGDVQPEGAFGAVNYTYSISKHEVTNAQYVEFLNAVAATDTNGLYVGLMGSSTRGGIIRTGTPGSRSYAVKPDAPTALPDGSDYTYGDKPVVYISFFKAMRFVNWLENGQPTGLQSPATTEEGVYTISDGVSETRAVSANYFIPSENEWHKAAYHMNDGMTGNYWDYPTASDALPNNNPPSADTGNSANFNQLGNPTGSRDYPMTDVGAYTQSLSPYGTFDLGGNVEEWHDTPLYGGFRGLRGGALVLRPGVHACVGGAGTPTRW